MKYSVIIPIHNAEEFLEECLLSCAGQIFDDLEVIMVVNASSDGSEDICRRRAGEDERFRLLVTETPGVSHARNMGLEAARGEWIVFLDADDYLLPDALETLDRGTCQGEDISMVIAGYGQTDPPEALSENTGIMTPSMYRTALLDAPSFYKKAEKEGISFTWKAGVFDVPWGKAYRAGLLREKGIRFDESVTVYEDLLFNLDFSMCCRKIFYADHPICFYRIREDSLSRMNSLKNVENRIVYMKKLEERAASCGESALKEELVFHLGQSILRTAGIAGHAGESRGKAWKALRDYAETGQARRTLMSLRETFLSMGKIQERYFRVLLLLMKGRRYRAAELLSRAYAAFKKSD